ncbi:MAG: isopenicillin N synthase family oxygenase [Candidatus Latescibacteria bacterium]|jgi:isopenicillin N synthase-like dioxygenase|nr:isopenicillin N synthase family oxygenase [Candidatus Latescibacterota bacterium]
MPAVSKDFQDIPVIDIGSLLSEDFASEAMQEAATEIGVACQNVGFFYITNHGIPESHRQNMFSGARSFFELPEDQKMVHYIGNSKNYNGYVPLGGEVTEKKTDWHACLDFHTGFDPERPPGAHPLWDSTVMPSGLVGFRELILKNWDLMTHLGSRLTVGLALSLGLEGSYFLPFTRDSLSTLRLSHYPPIHSDVSRAEVDAGIGAHCDYGFLTVLAQDDVGGLEVRNASGEWIAAPYIPGTYIVNIGQMTQQWTNDRYRATRHRVLLSTSRERFSIPFFFEPSYETIVAPLDICCDSENPPRYEPCHFGEFIRAKFARSYAEHYQKPD